MTPAEVQSIRKQAGLSQTGLAALLSLSQILGFPVMKPKSTKSVKGFWRHEDQSSNGLP